MSDLREKLLYKPKHGFDRLSKQEAVEMEAYALYLNAAKHGKKALALLTISDNPFTGEGLTPQEVRETFTQMMEIALELA